VKIVNPDQAYSLGPAWELLESVQCAVSKNQTGTLKKKRSKEDVSSSRRVFPAVLPQLKPNGANIR
jgi:hypothetical protein